MTGRGLVFGVACAALVGSCVTTSSSRRGPGGECFSDRECLYGLVCRAADDGGASRCEYEDWGRCDDRGDCLAGHVCRDGVCTVECVTDGECDGGVCHVGECRAKEARECVLPSDCPHGQDCVGGRCVESLFLRCRSHLDCRPGERCVAGWCQ